LKNYRWGGFPFEFYRVVNRREQYGRDGEEEDDGDSYLGEPTWNLPYDQQPPILKKFESFLIGVNDISNRPLHMTDLSLCLSFSNEWELIDSKFQMLQARRKSSDEVTDLVHGKPQAKLLQPQR